MKKLFSIHQYLAEKMGICENTEIDNEYIRLETRFNHVCKLFSSLYDKTEELLQPNTTTRQKLKIQDSLSNKPNQKLTKYPQIEASLSNTFSKHCSSIGGEFGKILSTMSENFRALSDCKDNLECRMREEVLDKITSKKSEITLVTKLIKKMESHRLEFDAIKNRKGKEEQIEISQKKYLKSKTNAYSYLVNFIENNEKAHADLVIAFTKILDEYYASCSHITKNMNKHINESYVKLSDKQNILPPRFKSSEDKDEFEDEFHSIKPKIISTDSFSSFPEDSIESTKSTENSATVLFDFVGEEEDELTVQKGSKVEICSKVDDDWYLARYEGKTGLIPVSYIQTSHHSGL